MFFPLLLLLATAYCYVIGTAFTESPDEKRKLYKSSIFSKKKNVLFVMAFRSFNFHSFFPAKNSSHSRQIGQAKKTTLHVKH